MGDLGNGRDIDESAAGIGRALDEDRLGFVVDLAFEGGKIERIDPAHMPVEALEGIAELVDRAAIEPARGNEIVAGPHDRVEDEELGGMARGDGERRRSAFERGDALFEHGLRRVHDAGIDIAESLQAEERGGMVRVVEDEAGGLVDRRRTRAGRRVRLSAGMDSKCGKSGLVRGHE